MDVAPLDTIDMIRIKNMPRIMLFTPDITSIVHDLGHPYIVFTHMLQYNASKPTPRTSFPEDLDMSTDFEYWLFIK